MRRALPLLGLLVGCAPTAHVITVERKVWQQAVVPPPEGAVAVGPLAERGGVSIEGGLSAAGVAEPTDSRVEGALGHLSSVAAGHLRLAGRADDVVELGLGLEILPGDLVAPAATDLDEGDSDVGVIVRGGPQLRIAAPLGRTMAWTLDGDLRLNPVSVRREIDVRLDDGYRTEDGWSWSTDAEQDSEQWTRWPVLPRVGTGLAWTDGHAHLGASLLVQQALVVPGYTQDVWSCTYGPGEPGSLCEGPEMPPVLERTWLPTGSLSAGLQLGRTWLLGQLWVHLADDEDGVAASAPAGAMVSLRVPLFRARPELQPEAQPVVNGWRQVEPPASGWRQVEPPASGWRQVDEGSAPPGWRMVSPPRVSPPVVEPPLAIPAGEPPPPPVAPPPPGAPPVSEESHAPPPE